MDGMQQFVSNVLFKHSLRLTGTLKTFYDLFLHYYSTFIAPELEYLPFFFSTVILTTDTLLYHQLPANNDETNESERAKFKIYR